MGDGVKGWFLRVGLALLRVEELLGKELCDACSYVGGLVNLVVGRG